jgi:hypothetical protein
VPISGNVLVALNRNFPRLCSLKIDDTDDMQGFTTNNDTGEVVSLMNSDLVNRGNPIVAPFAGLKVLKMLNMYLGVDRAQLADIVTALLASSQLQVLGLSFNKESIELANFLARGSQCNSSKIYGKAIKCGPKKVAASH